MPVNLHIYWLFKHIYITKLWVLWLVSGLVGQFVQKLQQIQYFLKLHPVRYVLQIHFERML